MDIKNQKGFTGIEIVISVIVITVFISLIANLIVNITTNKVKAERKTQATYYAVDEIERIKAAGYKNEYTDKGISKSDILEESDINDDFGNFTGYHKKIIIEDYVFLKKDIANKQSNLVKQITVEISYRLKNKEQKIGLSTYITKE